MRICLVSQEYPPETPWGGIGTQTRNKARALARLGHEVHVLSRAADEGPDMRREIDEGVVVHRMQPPGFEFPIYGRTTYQLGYAWHVLGRLHSLMESVAFDVLDFPEFGAEGFAYQVDRTVWNWVPVVVHLHGPLAMFAEKMGWPDRRSRFSEVVGFMEQFSIQRADGLMACSSSVAVLAERYYGVPCETIDVVHCGIDVDLFQAGANGCSGPSRPTILFVGSIIENKGAHVLVEAALRLRAKYPDLRLRLLGHGGADLMEQLHARIRAEGAEANVEFCGFVPLDRLPESYRSAHVFCLPAEFEGFGQVYLEALACGCPVVASTAGGGPEAVSHGETGLLVPPNDVQATAAALDRLLGDPDLRRQMGRAGRRRVEEFFTMERYVRRVLAVYEKAIERSQGRPERHEDLRE